MWTLVWTAFMIWCAHAVILGIFAGATITFAGTAASASWVVPNTFSWASLSGLLPLITAYVVRKHKIGAKGDPDAEDPVDPAQVPPAPGTPG